MARSLHLRYGGGLKILWRRPSWVQVPPPPPISVKTGESLRIFFGLRTVFFGRISCTEALNLKGSLVRTILRKNEKRNSIALESCCAMQVFGIRKKQSKYYCCDCGKKLSARAKTQKWRKIPAKQKRCRNCSSRHRGLLRRQMPR